MATTWPFRPTRISVAWSANSLPAWRSHEVVPFFATMIDSSASFLAHAEGDRQKRARRNFLRELV
jgi:hypothetical protein